jgi:GNAT superfamily N-acetyltransferase
LLPDGYPRGYERRVVLRDDREVDLRPIIPGDLDELRQALAEADPDTIRNRFLGGRPPQTDEELLHLVTVDYDQRFAVVARAEGRGVGIARYEASADGKSAEVAVAVDPAWRRVGLASAMLQLLGEAAIEHGIERFEVEFVLANVDVGTLLKESRLPVVLHRHDTTAEAVVDLTAVLGEYREDNADGAATSARP